MSRLVMVIDMQRCVGCGACVLACQEEWGLPDGVQRNWVLPMPPTAPTDSSYTHYVGKCNHCGDAPCVDACPTGASFHDAQGLVRVDDAVCIHCGYCVDACPFDARQLHPESGRVVKCDCCAPRLDAGLAPACVEACPAGARIFGDLDAEDGPLSGFDDGPAPRPLETAELKTDPRVYYARAEEVVPRILRDHPPVPARGPVQGRILSRFLRPGLLGLGALAIIGQGAMLLLQGLRQRQATTGAGEAAPAHPDGAGAPERMLLRHGPAGIALHWLNAAAWFVQVVTGAGLLSSVRYRVGPAWMTDWIPGLFGGRAALLLVHVALGIGWLVVLIGYGLFGFRRYFLGFLKHLAPERGDLEWLRGRFLGLLRRDAPVLPAQGMYNAGQKLFGVLVAVGTLVIGATGLAMLAGPPGSLWVRWSIPLHFGAAGLVIVGLIVHLSMSLLSRPERPALLSMVHGRVPETYAREHHHRWWTQHHRNVAGR